MKKLLLVLFLYMAIDLSKYVGGTPGTWNVLGLQLPDYGFTETQANKASRNFYNPNTQTPAVAQQVKNLQNGGDTGGGGSWGDGAGQVKGVSDLGGDNGGVGGSGGNDGGGAGPTIGNKRWSSMDDYNKDLARANALGINVTELGNYDYQRQLDEQLNASYNPAYENLNTVEAQYRQEYPTSQAFIEQSYGEVLPQIQSEQATKQQGLKTQRTKAQQEEKNQISQARQRYNEFRQGLLTRFGGAGSTGEASQELLGRTTAQQLGQTEQNFGNLYGDITAEEKNVNDFYASKITSLEKEKQLKLQELKNTFDAQIRQINSQRTALDSEKAARRLGALQEYAAQARQMQFQAQQFQQQLEMWRQAKDEAINTAKQFNAKSFTIPSMPGVMGGFSITGQNQGSNTGGFIGGQGSFNTQKMLDKYGLTPTGYNSKTGAVTYGKSKDEDNLY